MDSLNILDLFSGAGGLSIGAASNFNGASFVAVEQDMDSCKTYSENHLNSTVVNASVSDFLTQAQSESFDLVIGGPPCQGFSQLGLKNNNDFRNGLWADFMAAVEKFRPMVFVMENVPNFLKSPEFPKLQSMVAKLGGYNLEHRVLNSHDYGSPQSRRRAFIVGWDPARASFEWPENNPVLRNLEDALEHIPQTTKDYEWGESKKFRSGLDLHVGRNYSSLSLERFAHIPAGGNRFDIPERLLADCWKRHQNGAADVMGRLSWNKPSVTIRTEFFKPEKGRYLHPEAMRALTHLEAALIQGFPGDFKFWGGRSSVARQIGNAVPAELAKALFSGISTAKLVLNRAATKRETAEFTAPSAGIEPATKRLEGSCSIH